MAISNQHPYSPGETSDRKRSHPEIYTSVFPAPIAYPPGMIKRRRVRDKDTLMKVALRLFAFQYMYSQRLPSEKPLHITEVDWQQLLVLQRGKQLVQLKKLSETKFTVILPERYDEIVHAAANDQVDEVMKAKKTRFRWWSDTNIDEIKPVTNVKASPFVERTITLPESILKHPYTRMLMENKRNAEIVDFVSEFFSNMFLRYVHPEDQQNLFTSAFHIKKGLIQTTHISDTFSEEIKLMENRLDALLLC
jgi:hypothetical protein